MQFFEINFRIKKIYYDIQKLVKKNRIRIYLKECKTKRETEKVPIYS